MKIGRYGVKLIAGDAVLGSGIVGCCDVNWSKGYDPAIAHDSDLLAIEGLPQKRR